MQEFIYNIPPNTNRNKINEKKNVACGGGILVVEGEGHLYLLETALVLLLSERAALGQTSLASSGSAQNLHRNHELSCLTVILCESCYQACKNKAARKSKACEE